MSDSTIPAADLKIAIVVDPTIERGALANRCAVLATGLAAHRPEIVSDDLVTADGHVLLGFTSIPISILAARSIDELRRLEISARQRDGCTTLVFLQRAQGMRSYAEYGASVLQSDAADLDVDAFIIAGPKKMVDSLTGSLPALR